MKHENRNGSGANRETEFLNPANPLVGEVVRWLCGDGRFPGRVRDAEGAKSLAHVLVVVPTAQSGRNLRLALAREAAGRGWGGVIPPTVTLPMQLVKPAGEALRAATSVEAAIAFQQYVKTHREEVLRLDRLVWPDAFEDLTARFALFDQLEDIWRTLAGRGILMRDVPAVGGARLESDWSDERGRWDQLAKLEAGYFDYLHERGVAYPTEAVHAARTHAAVVGEGIEEIVLPALADPVRVFGDVLGQQVAAGKKVTVLLHAEPSDAGLFDEWGWPKTEAWIGARRPVLSGLKDGDIVCLPNASTLARRVAADYPKAEGHSSLPGLALCDDDLHQPVAAAFLNCGYVVHNPKRHLLAQSSLGRLALNLMALYPEGELRWRECVALLASADVQLALGLSAAERAKVLKGADVVQNAYVPVSVPRQFAFPENDDIPSWQKSDVDAFRAAGRRLEGELEAARWDASLGVFLRRMLQWVFRAHRLAARADEKEFLAAAEAMRDFLAELEGPFVASFAPTVAEFEALARRAFASVAYSLEPDSPEALRTEGWLELPWSLSERVTLAGFHEGKVPDSVIGHPFLPDALRAELGLVTNDDRLARDTWILRELLASRAEHGVRAYVARANDRGDICRPSRLLYLCGDAALAARVRGLFGDLPEARTDRERRVDWPLALPSAVPPREHFSPSAIDAYVRCPFTYLLEHGLHMNVYEEKRELAANDFGTFVHAVLKLYADAQIARGDDQLTDAAEIRRLLVGELVPAVRARYGRQTLNVNLQMDAAAGRLAFFAEEQARWAQAGWRIRAAEYALDDDIPELGFRLRGSIDRVDENIADGEERPWCLLDYKTWDGKGKFNDKVMTSEKMREPKRSKHFDFARAMGYQPVFSTGKDPKPKQRVLSVQLPLYGKGYAFRNPQAPFAAMQFRYAVLGSGADETAILPALTGPQVDASLAVARRAVSLIGRNVFWPPGPTDEWKWRHGGLFVADPAADLAGTAWVREQEERLAQEGEDA